MTKLDQSWFGGAVEKFFGTAPFKLARKEDPDTSHQAAQAIDTTKMESLVFETIAAYGPDGCISDDVVAKLSHLPYSSVTARYRALLDKGYIEITGARKGQSGRLQRIMRKVG